MSTEDLKRIFSEAAEVAKAVPKEFREAAFNRAVDALLLPAEKKADTRQSIEARIPAGDNSGSDHAVTLIRGLDRTRHSEVSSASRVLDRALLVLRAARDDHSIDGLSATQIATVLTEKFRLRATHQAVRQALDAAGDKVDRDSSGKATSYRIMHPGDEYLKAGVSGSNRMNSSGRSTGRRSKSKAATQATNLPASSTKSSKKRSQTSGRPGPGEMLRHLVTTGFFATPKTIGDIQSHAQQNRAHTYGLNELSTPLRRAIHNNLLVRTKNSNGQYEYAAT